jgi:osomolarity two-component system, sensor histidine kinase CHK1
MIHQHVTKTPISPHELNPDIPLAVSKVIMKLMEKNAEDRYQSSSAIQADLKFILTRYEKGHPLDRFILGHTDNSSRFLIPQTLYGRETEINKLFTALEYIRTQGRSTLITVSGISGVGKSRLVHELQPRVVEARGRFCSGKFDQYSRGTVFYAIIQAVQDLVKQVLSESESIFEEARINIMKVLGAEAHILANDIPEVGMFLNSDIELVESTELSMAIGSMEKDDRFRTVLVKFLKIFAPKGKPLVIFLVRNPSLWLT